MTKRGQYNSSSPLTLSLRLIDIILFQRLQGMADADVRDVGIVVISVFVVLTAILIT
jgi:hypothetical protein